MKIFLKYFFFTIALMVTLNSVFAQAPVISYTPATNIYTYNTAITALTPTNTGGAVSSGALTTFTTIPGSTQPYGIAYDPTTGDIITNSFSGGAVYRYSPSGVLLNTYTTSINGGGPKDITVDASGNIYAADAAGGDIVKITPSGTTTIITGSPTAMNQPDGMAIDAAGNIYVADQGTDDIYKIAPGATTATVYARGFTDLYGVTVNSAGQVYASEYNPVSAVVKVTSGSTTGGTAFVSGFNSPRNLSIDASGNLYLADEGAGTIVKITPSGTTSTYVSGLTNPRATAFDVLGNTYIANSGGNNVEELSPSKYSINIPLPTGMSFNTSTGVISGTPTVTSPTTIYTIVAHNGSGSGYTTETITVDPTAPTGTGDYNCGPGVVNLSASGGLPAGGTYSWYAAATGGTALVTGAAYSPSITTTTTYYLAYTQGGVSCASRVAVVGTISANPVISKAPASGADFSYGFTAGSTSDISGSNNGTTHGSPVTTLDRYGISGNALSFTSSSSQYISTTTSYPIPGPQAFSISVWFNTTTAGGYLVGFGSSQTGNSASVDRVIYMGTNGELYFGVAPLGVKKTINTITTYNDGNWHHVVATFSAINGSNMYVDGALAASDPTMGTALSFTLAGRWRVAYDVISSWTNAPATNAATYFNGSLDDVAVANTELTSAQVNVLYGAGSSTFCAGNAFSLTANTVTGATYSWVGPGGSGFTSAFQNPTVPAANALAGIYVLTVTNATGCTSTINVTAPGNVITYTWSGAAGTTTLTTAGNWDHLPLFSSTSNLVVPTGLAKYPVLPANESVYGLTLGATATLSLNGFTLSVGCNIINNASTPGDGILYGANAASGITWNGSMAAQSYTGANTATTAELGAMTVNNSAGGTITINGGPIDIFNTLTMAQGNLSIGTSPAALNLKSTSTQSANVAAIPSTDTIKGTVNVERYFTGGAGYRGYRLISSPVYKTTVSSNNVYSINYLDNYVDLTGAGPITTTLFDKAGNPTLYLYREDQVPSNATFTSGNFWGISSLGADPSYSVAGGGTTASFNIPVGNGVMFFFRGNKASASLATETLSSYTTPVSVTTVTGGTLNQGQVIVHDWYTPGSANIGWTNAVANSVVRGFNLVGNPYASSIDWEQYNTTTTTTGIYANNISPAIYEFDPSTKNYGTYQVGGAFTNHGTRTIVSGQGFFVQAINSTNPQLIFNETAKTTTQNTGLNLLMAARADVAVINNSNPDQHLRLQLALDTVNTDDIYIGFSPTANAQYDYIEDAAYRQGSGLVSLSSFSSDKVALAINKLPLPKLNKTVIPLNVTASAYGAYKLNMTELKGIPQLYEIWLMDNYNKDSLDMRHNTTYAFDMTTDTNSYGSNRFQLVIRQNLALAVHLLNFTAAKATGGSQVVWKTENEQDYTNFTVERSNDGGTTFTVLGDYASSALGTYSYLDKTPPVAVDMYRLKIEDLNGAISYSNIVTLIYGNSDSTIPSNISVYPNPASSILNLAINQNNSNQSPGLSALQKLSLTPGINQSAGTPSYGIKIISTTGSVIKSVSSSQPTWQDNISSLVPGTYIIQVVNNNDQSVIGKGTFVKL